mmetsp:Transcript_5877/g.21476  ORF Transcript_5877/g.21476 Transcript_5877/m.21476 type:complete len:201 (+) Transcript_5877:1329-1931(+)
MVAGDCAVGAVAGVRVAVAGRGRAAGRGAAAVCGLLAVAEAVAVREGPDGHRAGVVARAADGGPGGAGASAGQEAAGGAEPPLRRGDADHRGAAVVGTAGAGVADGHLSVQRATGRVRHHAGQVHADGGRGDRHAVPEPRRGVPQGHRGVLHQHATTADGLGRQDELCGLGEGGARHAAGCHCTLGSLPAADRERTGHPA